MIMIMKTIQHVQLQVHKPVTKMNQSKVKKKVIVSTVLKYQRQNLHDTFIQIKIRFLLYYILFFKINKTSTLPMGFPP